ncbi:azurin [Pontibacter sp. HJ8]
MKKTGIAWIILACSFLFGCDGTTPEQEAQRPEQIHEEPLKQQETEQDTTLQPIDEINIKGIGTDLQTIAYDQDTLEVTADALVRINLTNEGSHPTIIHNIVFTQRNTYQKVALAGAEVGASGNYVPDSPVILAASPLALPGQTVQLEFKAPGPGVYEFVCTYPDHYKRMHGLLIVK